MKKIFLIFLLLFTFAYANDKTPITVLKVYDGDSILAKIEQSNSVFRIRLIDIDCFEGTLGARANCQAKKFNLTPDEIVKGGNIAGEILKQELKDKKIYFEFLGIDKYNRVLGIIYADKENINQKMLKTNYCAPYKYIKN